MAELAAAAAIDMAANAGLHPLASPYAATRSAATIQLVVPGGAIQLVGGSFAYDSLGNLTGGTIAAIDATPFYVATGFALDQAVYADLLAGGDVFGARAALFIGDDVVTGSQAADRLLGFDGDDALLGGFGTDDMNGNRGADTLEGGDDADTVHGGQGDDLVYGDGGDDLATGSRGDDTVEGGDGDDLLHGGKENDVLAGDAGDDRISGDLGDDVLYGRLGADSFFFGEAGGRDAIEDFAPDGEGDRIVVSRSINGTGIADVDDLLVRIRAHPDGQLLDLGGANVVLIRNYSAGEISAEHFVVV